MLLCPSFSLCAYTRESFIQTFFPHGNSTEQTLQGHPKIPTAERSRIKRRQEPRPDHGSRAAGRVAERFQTGRFNLARWSWWSERHPRNGIDSAYGHQLPSRPTCARRHPAAGQAITFGCYRAPSIRVSMWSKSNEPRTPRETRSLVNGGLSSSRFA